LNFIFTHQNNFIYQLEYLAWSLYGFSAAFQNFTKKKKESRFVEFVMYLCSHNIN